MSERDLKGTQRAGALPDTAQRTLELGDTTGQLPPEQGQPEKDRVRFVRGDRSRIFVGDVPLKEYLERNQLRTVTALVELMAELDMSAFEAGYESGGRPPIHPRILLGLIVYGIHLRQWSLRELEMLAVRDVGAWWVCEGIQPDHSTIGKFVVRHEALLSESFFVSATRQLARKLGLKEGELAADGTVIQAASGMRSIAKKAVLEEEAAAVRQQAQENPECAKLEKRAQRLEDAVAIAHERGAKRQAVKRSEPWVLRTEPESVHQPCKDGTSRFAYKPSVLVHEGGLIVGQTVEPLSEPNALAPMWQQREEIGVAGTSMALDRAYSNFYVLTFALSRDIDLLCPSERIPGRTSEDGIALNRLGRFAKAAFRYDEAKDVYVCPAGAQMSPGQWTLEAPTGYSYRSYVTKRCINCSLRPRCTTSKLPRQVRRYRNEELKEALAAVMAQPLAQERYNRRSKIVEPVFAELKERQGLKRFRRRRLHGVRVEFALHCLAHNLKRAAVVVVVVTVSIRNGGYATVLGVFLCAP